MKDPEHGLSTIVTEMAGVDVPSLRRPGSVCVRNVNWRVVAGDYWVVAGLAGAGKSDLLLMMAGLMPPSSGTYQLFGEAMPILEGDKLATRLRLGLVFDDGRLFNQLTVAENVALPLQYHRDLDPEEAGRAVMDVLELTELSSWAASTPGGMPWIWRKRAALARSLAMRPELLLLDDPLGGLDARHEVWWLRFLDQLSSGTPVTHGKPVTLIVTASSLDPWRERARQFAFLKPEGLEVIGSREQLAASPGAAAEDYFSKLSNQPRY